MSVVLVLVVVDVLLSHGLTETSVEGARSKLWLRAAAACAACRAQQGANQCNQPTNKGAKHEDAACRAQQERDECNPQGS